VSGKSIIAVLAIFLAGLLWVMLKETAVAIAVEVAIESFAERIGVSRPQMIAAASPFVFAVLAASAVAWISYGVGVRDRKNKSPLEIVYNINNPRNIETRTQLYGSETRYHVGVRNKATDRTVHDLEITWDPTPFTKYIDGAVRPRDHGEDRAAALDPRETQYAYLVGLDDKPMLFADYSMDIFKHPSFFTVRARSKDAGEVTAEFEYNPFQFPRIFRIR
jgi:hypothetical protein